MLPTLKPTTKLLEYLRDMSMNMSWNPGSYGIGAAVIIVANNPDRTLN